MALPEITKYENFEDPSSPLYVPEEERSTWDYYRPIDGVYDYPQAFPNLAIVHIL